MLKTKMENAWIEMFKTNNNSNVQKSNKFDLKTEIKQKRNLQNYPLLKNWRQVEIPFA